jgi:2-octaprenyl-6-methoxyphenol hydroxylase
MDSHSLPLPEALSPIKVAIIGAGPVGLALALPLADLPGVQVTLHDQRAEDADLQADPRTLALSLGSVQALRRLGVWPEVAAAAAPIRQVHVSQAAGLPWARGHADGPHVWLRAADQGVDQLGAVCRYGAVLAPLHAAWSRRQAAQPQRLVSRWGTRVQGLKAVDGGVEVDAGIVETHDLVVVAEGGTFGEQPGKPLTHDYGQTAWIGEVTLEGVPPDAAFERFTNQGPLALLPLPAAPGAPARAALVWCTDRADDPVATLDEAGRRTLMQALLPPSAGRVTAVSALKAFPLGLNAEWRLVQGRQVRIGNAAQTLHPVAGQGLNLGLRDAHELAALLARHPRGAALDAALATLERRRRPDRAATVATTHLLAEAFTWNALPVQLARAAGLSLLGLGGPAPAWLARRLMFGWR